MVSSVSLEIAGYDATILAQGPPVLTQMATALADKCMQPNLEIILVSSYPMSIYTCFFFLSFPLSVHFLDKSYLLCTNNN